MGPLTWFSINIIKATGTRLDPAKCALAERVASVGGQITAAFASLRLSRKSVFSFTCLVMCCSWFGLAITVFINDVDIHLFGDMDTATAPGVGFTVIDYLPPIFIFLVRFSFQIALAPYPWIYGNELFPLDLRSYLCAITASLEPIQVKLIHKIVLCNINCCFQQFIMVSIFPVLIEVTIFIFLIWHEFYEHLPLDFFSPWNICIFWNCYIHYCDIWCLCSA